MHLVGATVKSATAGEPLRPVLHAAKDRPSLLVWDIKANAPPGWPILTFDRRAFGVTYAHIRAGFIRECTLRDYDLIVMRHALFCSAKERVIKLRRAGCRTPIMLVSEAMRHAECVEILDAGADDFVLETIDGDEFGARIRAVLRRTRWTPDGHRARAPRDAEEALPARLTYRESVVFQMLARRAGTPVSKLAMEQALFGGKVVQSNIIQTVIYGLRCKLGAENILTQRQVGYVLTPAFAREGR